jgi:hypothetical protein
LKKGALSGLSTALVAVAASVSVGCGNGANARDAAEPPRNIVVHTVGDQKYVVIDDMPRDPVNPQCVAYCKQLAACWHAIPNADPGQQPREVVRHCMEERNDCRTTTTDSFCCAQQNSCFDFSQCHSRSRDMTLPKCPSDAQPTAISDLLGPRSTEKAR